MKQPRARNGTTQPDYGPLAELFSSQVRADVLVHMVSHRSAACSLTELSRALGLAVSSVQHEIYKLERLGILIGRRDGNSRRYRLTIEHPLTQALERLVQTSIGIEASLLGVLSDTPGLIWSTVATSSRNEVSEAMLVLVGSLDLSCLSSIQQRIADILDIPVDRLVTSFHSPEVWMEHVRDAYPLVRQLEQLDTLAVYGAIE